MFVIETKHLTKSYGKARGVIDVNLTVEEGEIYGFIGPNGAGKSTTIRSLLGLISPTNGEALIFGKNCAAYPAVRAKVGYLPSEVFYYDKMKVIDLLNYSASFYKKDCTKRISELADILELDLKKRIDDLSFGNKKKVGIVQGLLHEPELIILDEPTGGLDPLMQQRFFELIRSENKRGATVFFSSHILSEVQRLCGRVALIRDGQIVTTEKIADLQENSYKRFTVETRTEPSPDFLRIDGVSDFTINGLEIKFIYRGNINTVMKKLAETELQNITVSEPDLEEIFLHYYAGEG